MSPSVGRSAVILAGGNSSRMGEEKDFLEFDGKPLLSRTVEKLGRVTDEIVVVARDEAQAELLGKLFSRGQAPGPRLLFTWDSVKGFGPVAGLDAGMAIASGTLAFAAGCDLPFLKPEVVSRLFEKAEEEMDLEAVVPIQAEGVYEPLHSVYRREKMLFLCRRALEKGERRIYNILQDLRIRCVRMECFRPLDPELLSFFNLNTPLDLEAARALWQLQAQVRQLE
ncbi:Molybdenum cofactor guanylyltransferase [uncultured archaeon]|nr:Molybdenum cofactor guanylyltransferase [uncultured archaeon]